MGEREVTLESISEKLDMVAETLQHVAGMVSELSETLTYWKQGLAEQRANREEAS